MQPRLRHHIGKPDAVEKKPVLLPACAMRYAVGLQFFRTSAATRTLAALMMLVFIAASPRVASAAMQSNSTPIGLPPLETPNPPPPTEDNPLTAGLADQFFQGTFLEAAAEAKQRYRLLVVYACDPKHPSYELVEKRVWQNPIVRAWIAWHAVLYRAKPGDFAPLKRSSGIGRNNRANRMTFNSGHGPIFYCFADGRLIDMWVVLQSEDVNWGIDFEITKFHPDAEVARVGGMMASGALSYLDFTLRRALAMDQIFQIRHEHANPEPTAPPRPDPLWQTGDAWAPSLSESLEQLGLDPSHAADDPLEFLLRARRLLNDGFTRDAVTHYTWLWNRTDTRAPWLRAWRRTIVQADIRQIAATTESGMQRFDHLRSIETHRLAWAQWPELYDWMFLASAVGKTGDIFLYAWGLVLPDDQTLTTAIETRVYRAMLARSDMTNPWELPPGDPVKRVIDLWAMAAMGETRHSTPSELEEARAFLRELAHDESCRLHAACLIAKRDADAQRIAELLVSRAEQPEDALVAMLAVAVGARIELARLGHIIGPIADDERALRLLAWSAELEREPGR